MSQRHRDTVREIAQRHLAVGDALGWFEDLYAQARGDASIIPWADLTPNPNLTPWLESQKIIGHGRNAIKIGCGLGDDAEELVRRGFDTTAFDISPTAIDWCTRRFPHSKVHYSTVDLFHAPIEWRNSFDFVLESYTLQVLPPELRAEAAHIVAGFLRPGGTLLVIARGRDLDDPPGEMPWPLTRAELGEFQKCALKEISFEDYQDQEDPPVRRFRAVYHTI